MKPIVVVSPTPFGASYCPVPRAVTTLNANLPTSHLAHHPPALFPLLPRTPFPSLPASLVNGVPEHCALLLLLSSLITPDVDLLTDSRHPCSEARPPRERAPSHPISSPEIYIRPVYVALHICLAACIACHYTRSPDDDQTYLTPPPPPGQTAFPATGSCGGMQTAKGRTEAQGRKAKVRSTRRTNDLALPNSC